MYLINIALIHNFLLIILNCFKVLVYFQHHKESYSEYYLTDKADVETFIKNFAINHEDFDYSTALDMETMSNPDTVAKGPQIIKQ